MDGSDQRLAENYGTVIGLLSGKADNVPAMRNTVYTDNVTLSIMLHSLNDYHRIYDI